VWGEDGGTSSSSFLQNSENLARSSTSRSKSPIQQTFEKFLKREISQKSAELVNMSQS